MPLAKAVTPISGFGLRIVALVVSFQQEMQDPLLELHG